MLERSCTRRSRVRGTKSSKNSSVRVISLEEIISDRGARVQLRAIGVNSMRNFPSSSRSNSAFRRWACALLPLRAVGIAAFVGKGMAASQPRTVGPACPKAAPSRRFLRTVAARNTCACALAGVERVRPEDCDAVLMDVRNDKRLEPATFGL